MIYSWTVYGIYFVLFFCCNCFCCLLWGNKRAEDYKQKPLLIRREINSDDEGDRKENNDDEGDMKENNDYEGDMKKNNDDEGEENDA